MKLNIGQFSNWFWLLAVILIHLAPIMEGLIGSSAQSGKDKIKRDLKHKRRERERSAENGGIFKNAQFMQAKRFVGVVAPVQLLEQRQLERGFQTYIKSLNLSLPANLQVDFLPDNGVSFRANLIAFIKQ